ncbi:peptidase M48 [Brevirhabdus pacifica]|uniref:Peptidase M48 n=1 Tax=Brevirhabdus pacifica TaxID=1267768 RepID=A0A1U7DM99_9RHOB|nr:M48 family metallopeptidase [Brevirhabdus pacifica]APX91136.1 peptidase M48 [Brevirhabdus pacifica]OWU78862.1 peptidase M48 [Loktanella sp. 22II-4b]PJJ85503.1 peptidase M48-like protein [Brevirhabdus pacifica]
MRVLPLVALMALTACEVTTVAPRGDGGVGGGATATTTPDRISPRTAVNNFVAVVQQVEPVAERECRQRNRRLNCDFAILVDDRPGQPANAYQTVDKDGRPVVVFTLALIGDARNRDELAFVLGHETAHHIAGHLPRQQTNAQTGAILGGILASVAGASDGVIRTAQQIGATVGTRRYSKDLELEADELGTIITARAGYDPVKGAEFFTRIPDPGDRFLGSHPANSQRIETVRRTAAGL